MASTEIQSIERVAQIIEHLARRRGARLTELSRATGLPPSTVHRFLHSMRKHGLVERHSHTAVYLPGLRLFEWGHAAVSARRLRELSRPWLQRLADESGYPCTVGLVDGGDVLIVDWLPGRKYLRGGATGERWPLHLTGMGWAILAAWSRQRAEAHLERVLAGAVPPGVPPTLAGCRRLLAAIGTRGYSVMDSLSHPDCRALGAAVVGSDGTPLGGLATGGPIRRLPDDLVPTLGHRLAECAADISAALGYAAPALAGAR